MGQKIYLNKIFGKYNAVNSDLADASLVSALHCFAFSRAICSFTALLGLIHQQWIGQKKAQDHRSYDMITLDLRPWNEEAKNRLSINEMKKQRVCEGLIRGAKIFSCSISEITQFISLCVTRSILVSSAAGASLIETQNRGRLQKCHTTFIQTRSLRRWSRSKKMVHKCAYEISSRLKRMILLFFLDLDCQKTLIF